jgi:hypothetical protein
VRPPAAGAPDAGRAQQYLGGAPAAPRALGLRPKVTEPGPEPISPDQTVPALERDRQPEVGDAAERVLVAIVGAEDEARHGASSAQQAARIAGGSRLGERPVLFKQSADDRDQLGDGRAGVAATVGDDPLRYLLDG